MDESKLLEKLRNKLGKKPSRSVDVEVEGDDSGDCYQMLIDGVKANDKDAVKEALFMCFDEYSSEK